MIGRMDDFQLAALRAETLRLIAESYALRVDLDAVLSRQRATHDSMLAALREAHRPLAGGRWYAVMTLGNSST